MSLPHSATCSAIYDDKLLMEARTPVSLSDKEETVKDQFTCHVRPGWKGPQEATGMGPVQIQGNNLT